MIALWAVLIVSVSFGVYKNFTAIDMHTVHEKETVQLRLNDTDGIENFVPRISVKPITHGITARKRWRSELLLSMGIYDRRITGVKCAIPSEQIYQHLRPLVMC